MARSWTDWLWVAGATVAGAVALGAARGGRTGQGEGRIVAPGVDYLATDEDWLWLARSLLGESGSHRGRVAAAWAMISRFAARRQGGREETLAALVRGFSQPVNPIWRTADGCTSDGRGCCGRTTDPCSPAQLARRQAFASRDWAWLEANARDVVEIIEAFRSGNPPRNPIPGYTNFAACGSVEGGLNIEGNCFFRNPTLNGTVDVV